MGARRPCEAWQPVWAASPAEAYESIAAKSPNLPASSGKFYRKGFEHAARFYELALQRVIELCNALLEHRVQVARRVSRRQIQPGVRFPACGLDVHALLFRKMHHRAVFCQAMHE